MSMPSLCVHVCEALSEGNLFSSQSERDRLPPPIKRWLNHMAYKDLSSSMITASQGMTRCWSSWWKICKGNLLMSTPSLHSTPAFDSNGFNNASRSIKEEGCKLKSAFQTAHTMTPPQDKHPCTKDPGAQIMECSCVEFLTCLTLHFCSHLNACWG